jgi:hypothetical protein
MSLRVIPFFPAGPERPPDYYPDPAEGAVDRNVVNLPTCSPSMNHMLELWKAAGWTWDSVRLCWCWRDDPRFGCEEPQ